MRVAVVGAGVVGLAATAALLDRGAQIRCHERTGTVLGQRSAGSSRIFRLAHATPELVEQDRAARSGFARREAVDRYPGMRDHRWRGG